MLYFTTQQLKISNLSSHMFYRSFPHFFLTCFNLPHIFCDASVLFNMPQHTIYLLRCSCTVLHSFSPCSTMTQIMLYFTTFVFTMLQLTVTTYLLRCSILPHFFFPCSTLPHIFSDAQRYNVSFFHAPPYHIFSPIQHLTTYLLRLSSLLHLFLPFFLDALRYHISFYNAPP